VRFFHPRKEKPEKKSPATEIAKRNPVDASGKKGVASIPLLPEGGAGTTARAGCGKKLRRKKIEIYSESKIR